MNEKEKYIEDNFFQPEKEPEYKGSDAFGYALHEGDEVFVYENNEQQYLLISEMKPSQRAMARTLGLRKEVL